MLYNNSQNYKVYKVKERKVLLIPYVYKEADFGNGLKIKYKAFDCSTPEGVKEWSDYVCGSVQDETFVAPPDGYEIDDRIVKMLNV